MAEENNQAGVDPSGEEQKTEQGSEQSGQGVNLAQQIVDAAEEEFEYSDLSDQIHNEYGELNRDTEQMARQFMQTAKRYRNNDDAATKAELAELYEALAGDVLSLQKDVIGLTAGAFRDVFSILMTDGDSEDETEGEDDDDGEPDQEAVQIYVTLQQNLGVFQGLIQSPGATEAFKQALQNQVALTEASVSIFEEQYGESIKKIWMQMVQELEQAQAAANGQAAKQEESSAGR